ncbi:MAG TPA: EamA family transporter [Streptosporangiaceae bacterium]|jgi:drug/metabolite transporter (DMT)-like permease
MTYGLLTALCWGISALLAAVAVRRIGALRTLVIGETVALAAYGTLFWAGHFSLRGAGPSAWLLLLAGVIGVAGYLALYRGLESGHIGLVSAISACYGGVTAVLSVILLHERLTAAATAGIVATVAGVMLAVIRRPTAPTTAVSGPVAAPVPDAEPAVPVPVPATLATPVVPPAAAPAIGAVFGLAAALFYGVSGFMLGRYSYDLGWLVPVVIARSGAMVFLLALLATPLRAPSPSGAGRTRAASAIAWAMAAGLVDAAGLAAFTRGDQVGLVAVTAAVSSAYPAIPLIGGLLFFRERLMRWQAGGAVLILAGLVLLGLGS